MAPGDLTIHRVTHLPREKTLLIHYGLSETGSWIYSLCHCGYRGVCENNWTIMIPNHQHPQHTDARPGQRLYVNTLAGREGIFAWNYGGIKGVSSEDFDSDHSYLVQLTVQKDCAPISPTGRSGEFQTGVHTTGTVPLFTGKGGPIGIIKAPVKKPPGKGPPAPNPGSGIPIGDPRWGPLGGQRAGALPPRGIPPSHKGAPPLGLPGGHSSSTSVPFGLIRDRSITERPISLYPNVTVGGVIRIEERGMNYRQNKADAIRRNTFFGGGGNGGGAGGGGGEGGGGFGGGEGGGGSMLGSQGGPGQDDTSPGNWEEINLLGFHNPPESWLFGDGNEHAKEGDPRHEEGVADNVVDVTKYTSAIRLRVTRDHSPNGPREDNKGLNFPVVTSLPLRPGGQTNGPILPTEESTSPSLDEGAASLGIDSSAHRTFAQEGPAPVSADTIDSGQNGETLLVLSSTSLYQGEKLNISSIFLPSTPGTTVPVKGSLMATDSIGSSFTIVTTDLINSSHEQPAGISADIRTDKFSLGDLFITAVYRDTNQKTVGIATETTTVLQPIAEASGDVIDVYTDVKRDDISEGLRNATQVGTTPLSVIIPQGGERTLILVPTDTELASNDVSLVLATKVISSDDSGMMAAMYDLDTSSDADRIGTSAVSTGPTVTQPIKKFGTHILKATGPTILNGAPAFVNEHILGHTPVSTTSDSILLSLTRFASSDYGSTDLFLYLHKKLKMRLTDRTSLTRSGATVSLTYSTPFSVETVKLVVIGFRGDDIPSDVTFIENVTDINGTVSFANVTAQKEHYISLLSYPYRLGQDEFYTELLDG